MNVISLHCPACNAPEFASLGRGLYACGYCGTTFTRADVRCPACSRPVLDEAEACPHCGEPLTVVGAVVSRHLGTRPPRWLLVARAQAGEIRSQDLPLSQQRMQALLDIDQRRLASAAQEESRRRIRDRQTLTVAAALCVGLVVLFLAAALWQFR
jgi:hypothetical protein